MALVLERVGVNGLGRVVEVAGAGSVVVVAGTVELVVGAGSVVGVEVGTVEVVVVVVVVVVGLEGVVTAALRAVLRASNVCGLLPDSIDDVPLSQKTKFA